MGTLRNGQASAFNIANDIGGEDRIFERAFGLVLSSTAEAVRFINANYELEVA